MTLSGFRIDFEIRKIEFLTLFDFFRWFRCHDIVSFSIFEFRAAVMDQLVEDLTRDMKGLGSRLRLPQTVGHSFSTPVFYKLLVGLVSPGFR